MDFALAHDIGRDLVFAQALERRLADIAAGRPAAQLNLGDELWRHPHGFNAAATLFHRHLYERTFFLPQGSELLVEVARYLVGIAGAGAAGIFEFTALIVADNERADRLSVGRRRGVARNHQLLAVGALGLQ